MEEPITIIQLSGEDGNIFNLIGIASKALRADGKKEQAKEMTDKVFDCKSYQEALAVIQQYCIVS